MEQPKDDGYIWMQGTRFRKTTCGVGVLVFIGIILALALILWISAQF